MFWLLLSSACPVPGISLPLQPGDAAGQQLPAGQRDTPSHTAECSATTPLTPQTQGTNSGGVAFQGCCCLETVGHHSACGRGRVVGLASLLVPSPLTPSTCQTIFHSPNHLYPHLGVFSLHSLSHPAVGRGNKCGCLAAAGGHSTTHGKSREEKKSIF